MQDVGKHETFNQVMSRNANKEKGNVENQKIAKRQSKLQKEKERRRKLGRLQGFGSEKNKTFAIVKELQEEN